MMDEFKIIVPGFTIACKTWGNKNQPPILALHGWLDNANSFAPLAAFLQNEFYLIAVDLPGHGLSSHLAPGCNYHFIDGIFNIVNIMNALGYEKLHLLGHSLGACLASLVAGVVPDKLSSLALIEALGPFSGPEQACRSQLANYVNYLGDDISGAKPYASMELAAKARAKSGHLPMEFARILCQRGVKEEQGKFFWCHDRRLVHPTPLRLTEMQIISCLEGIDTKSCLITADNGFEFNKADIQNRVNAVQNLAVINMPGGHHLHMENPGAVSEHLIRFYHRK